MSERTPIPKEYTVDTRGRLTKDIGGFLSHPLAFENETMVAETVYLLGKREENRLRVDDANKREDARVTRHGGGNTGRHGPALSITSPGNPRRNK